MSSGFNQLLSRAPIERPTSSAIIRAQEEDAQKISDALKAKEGEKLLFKIEDTLKDPSFLADYQDCASDILAIIENYFNGLNICYKCYGSGKILVDFRVRRSEMCPCRECDTQGDFYPNGCQSKLDKLCYALEVVKKYANPRESQSAQYQDLIEQIEPMLETLKA